MELPQNITQARESAQALTAGASELGAQQHSIGDVLKQKALDAYKANQDIIKPLDVATTEYIQAPSEARAKYVDPGSENYVFNPFQAENLVSQYVSQQAIPMLGLSSILGQRFGRIEDTIGAGTRAFQAQVAARQAKAQQAQQMYQDLLNEYVTGEDMRLAREKWEWDKANAGGGGGGGGFGLTGGSDWEIVSEEGWDWSQYNWEDLPLETFPQLQQQPQNTQIPQTLDIGTRIKDLLGKVTWPWEKGPGQQFI